MYDKNSKIKTLWDSPLGNDILDLILYMTGINPTLIKNPLIGNLALFKLPALTKNLADEDFINTLVELLNRVPEKNDEEISFIEKKWWKSAVFYQIYPRSFKDSNNDGIGDVQGIIEKLDYLEYIGVDALWLSPVYDSPNDDNGYDIRDYEKIMSEFGNMSDFDQLLAETKKRNMKLIMDLVINHTSDEHVWFQKALNDKDSPYKDYYIFKKGKAGGPPNNWTSAFKGSAWNYYESLDEYALHIFSKKQMDLNWENENMRKDIYDMINFWLEKGIDGFRLDVINLISKPRDFPDGSESLAPLLGATGYEHIFYGPGLREYLIEMHKETFSKYDAFTVGEGAGIGMEITKVLTATKEPALDQIFNFDALNNPSKTRYDSYKYDLKKLKPLLLKWQKSVKNGVWPTFVFENHDNPRFSSRVTKNPEYRDIASKLVITLMLTLQGTPYFYQGQEIGMIDGIFEHAEDFRDVEAINMYNEYIEQGIDEKTAVKNIAVGTRDNARIPMQWEDVAYGGFSEVRPWINPSRDYMNCNVKKQIEDKDSVLNYFRDLILLRKSDETFIYGEFINASADNDVFCYYRTFSGVSYYVEINLLDSNKKRPIRIDKKYVKVLSNYEKSDEILRPYEATIYKTGGKS